MTQWNIRKRIRVAILIIAIGSSVLGTSAYILRQAEDPIGMLMIATICSIAIAIGIVGMLMALPEYINKRKE